MAPTIAEIPQPQFLHLHLFTRASDPNNPSLTSVFALIVNRARNLALAGSNAFSRSLASRSTHRSAAAVSNLSINKRQQQILVIPTTYANLRTSPAPGAVVGITLGAIFGFLLALLIMLLIFRALGGAGTAIIEEEIVTKRSRRSHSKSTKKHSPTTSSSSGIPPIPEPAPESFHEPEVIVMESRRASRVSRRESRTSRRASRVTRRSPEQVIVEEEQSSIHDLHPEEVIVIEEESEVHTADLDEVVVEEEESDHVEVIEDHSPSPPPRRRTSAAPPRRSSTFRIVDPAEFGGGDAPSRRISRATNRGG